MAEHIGKYKRLYLTKKEYLQKTYPTSEINIRNPQQPIDYEKDLTPYEPNWLMKQRESEIPELDKYLKSKK